MGYLLGIDLGTSGTKTVLFDLEGRAICSASREYPMDQPRIGWAEQDPEDWVRATFDTIEETVKKSGVNPRDIMGMGLSGQMHGMVLLDAEDKVLRPAIIWCDQRTARECKQMEDLVGRERLIEITANPAMTGFTASKVMWVKNNQPEIFERTRKVLLPKDYVRLRLTGEYATEVSDASGMQFLDVPRRAWSREVLDKLGVPYEWMPQVYESYEISGKLTAAAAEKTGLWTGMPVAGGGGDNAAGAVGTGVVRPGVAFCTIGTSGVVFAHSNTPDIDPQCRIHTLCHAVPGAWHTMGVVQSAGLSLRWFRDEFCAPEVARALEEGRDVYDVMSSEAAQVAPGSSGLIYLPYLMGERSPHMDPVAKGVFFGISGAHTRKHFIRAVMEGVTYGLNDSISIMREMGIGLDQIRAGGGGGRSPLWRQMQADIFGANVVTAQSPEAGALGVALLAGVGVGAYASVPEACDAVIKVSDPQTPNAADRAAYMQYYPTYKALYAAVKPSYDVIADIIG